MSLRPWHGALSEWWGQEGKCEWAAAFTPWVFPTDANLIENFDGQLKSITTSRKRYTFGVLLGVLQNELRFQTTSASALVSTVVLSPDAAVGQSSTVA